MSFNHQFLYLLEREKSTDEANDSALFSIKTFLAEKMMERTLRTLFIIIQNVSENCTLSWKKVK